MDGRRPTGLMYVNTDVDAPHKRDEYHRWYVDVHFPDVTEPAQFSQAAMFRNAREPVPPGEGHFLALYETERADLEATAEAFEKHVDLLFRESRIHKGTVGRVFVICRQLHVQLATSRRRRSQSLVAVHLDAVDDRAQELRDWHCDVRVARMLEEGVFHTASLNERIGGEAFRSAIAEDQPRFIEVYESDFGDPGALAETLDPPEAMPDFVRARGVSLFYRTSP